MSPIRSPELPPPNDVADMVENISAGTMVHQHNPSGLMTMCTGEKFIFAIQHFDAW